MAELDLASAAEAAYEALLERYRYIPTGVAEAVRADIEAGLTAALPHILDALAEEAVAPVRFDLAGPAGYSHAQDGLVAARWLRAKAEEVRGG